MTDAKPLPFRMTIDQLLGRLADSEGLSLPQVNALSNELVDGLVNAINNDHRFDQASVTIQPDYEVGDGKRTLLISGTTSAQFGEPEILELARRVLDDIRSISCESHDPHHSARNESAKSAMISLFSFDRVLSGLALIVAIASAMFTFSVQREQDRQWALLNLARLDLVDAGLVTFRQIKQDEISRLMPVSSKLIVRRVRDGGIAEQDASLLYELRFVRVGSDPVEPVGSGFHTFEECDRERKRLGIPEDTKEFEIRQHIQLYIDFRNGGATEAIECLVDLEGNEDKHGLIRLPSSCAPGKGIMSLKDIYLNNEPSRNLLSMEIPPDMDPTSIYYIKSQFTDIKGDRHCNKWPLTWRWKTNEWKFGDKHDCDWEGLIKDLPEL